MNSNLFARLTAPAAVAAAALGVPGDLYHFSIDTLVSGSDTLLFKVHGWLLLVAMGLLVLALAGIALRLAGRDGRLAAVPMAVIAMTFTGTLLVIGSISTEAFVMPEVGAAVADPTGYRLTVIVASYALFASGGRPSPSSAPGQGWCRGRSRRSSWSVA